MIIQTGMRTDIPAFYPEWLKNRIEEGYVLVRNPYNPFQVTRYRLNPDVVDLIGFCTKNPAPMFPYMDVLKSYGQYWFVTITPYGKDLEPNVPAKEKVMDDFCRLSDMVGVDSIGWRYDPILLNETYTLDWHIESFRKMSEKLSGYTHTCVISFIDLYKKVQRNFPEAREMFREDRIRIGKAFVEIAKEHQIVIRPCAEGKELEAYGADCSGCMTEYTYETALHTHLDFPKRGKNQRNNTCACTFGSDIGAYDTCGHLCRYCYANTNVALVQENRKRHDPKSPFLVGGATPQDVIHEAVQKKWRDDQLRFDLF